MEHPGTGKWPGGVVVGDEARWRSTGRLGQRVGWGSNHLLDLEAAKTMNRREDFWIREDPEAGFECCGGGGDRCPRF